MLPSCSRLALISPAGGSGAIPSASGFMMDNVAPDVLAIQDSLAYAAEEYFLEQEVANLRVLVRLAVEYYSYLKSLAEPSTDSKREADFVSGSIFSGMPSFTMISAA